MIFDMVQNANTKDKFILKTLFSGWAEIWTKGFTLQSRHSATWKTPPVHFALVILEMGSCEIFA
jgi:hypothetical protein